jgi:hypothetical protein
LRVDIMRKGKMISYMWEVFSILGASLRK